MSFTTTKDRIWVAYDSYAAWLARRNNYVRKAGYSIFGFVLWIAYIFPGSTIRATFKPLAHHSGLASSTRLFGRYVRGFLRGLNRTEQVRHGHTDAVEAMLEIPEHQRLETLLETSGVILVIAHTHASIAMARGLGQKFPLLALVRTTKNEKRAASERELYKQVGCEFLDVRRENHTAVARKVLQHLRQQKLIIGTVDRIGKVPPAETPINAASDTVRVLAFGEPIGITGWPARFGFKMGCPIIPVFVVQTDDTMKLVLGDEVIPTDDLIETTQAWVGGLEKLMKSHPDEWAFAIDKNWSAVLRNSIKD